MTNQNTNNIVLPRSVIRGKEGVVILPLEKWEKIEGALEDLEMYQSESLTREIDKRRKEKENTPLEKILKKHHI